MTGQHATTFNIAFWGPQGSGKTWLISSFAKELSLLSRRDSRFDYLLFQADGHPISIDAPNLVQATQQLVNREWVFRRNPKFPQLEQEPEIISFTHRLSIHDNRGASTIASIIDRSSNRPTWTTLISSNYLVIVLDPTTVKNSSSTGFEGRESEVDFVIGQLVENEPKLAHARSFSQGDYHSLLSDLFSYIVANANDPSNKHIAICLTKVDATGLRGDALRNTRILFGEGVASLISNYDSILNIEVFSTSAAGFYRKEGKSIPNINGEGKIADEDSWEPLNVSAPFFWMFETVERKILATQKPPMNGTPYPKPKR